jgi:hypothetical protein
MVQENKARNGMGIASLVLGIVMLVLGAVPIVWIAGVLGIIFGIIGRKRAKAGTATNGTMAMWGLVLSIVGTVAWGVAKFMAGYNSV